MKIGLQSVLPHYKPIIDSKYQPASTQGVGRSTKNFDEVTISSEQGVSQEQQFVSALTSRVSLELRRPVSSDRIEELQQMIDQGKYEVDVNAIADKIMLY